MLRIHLAVRGRNPADLDLETLARKKDRFSRSELEQVVLPALCAAFSAGRELVGADLVAAAAETVPLATTYEDRIQALREWARSRARPATLDRRKLDAFRTG